MWVSFFDELTKIAIRLRGLHGTSGQWEELIPAYGGQISEVDPNPPAVYAMLSKRRLEPKAKSYAQKAVEARGGTPTVSKVIIDTSKGWRPHGFTPEGFRLGQQEVGSTPSIQDMRDLVMAKVEEADKIKSDLSSLSGEKKEKAKQTLGQLYQTIQKMTGSWSIPGAVKPIAHKMITSGV